jgi:hypothetical protein
MPAVKLHTLKPGDRFTVAAGYLAPGGSSDAGVLTVSDRPAAQGRVATTDGRQLHAAMLVDVAPAVGLSYAQRDAAIGRVASELATLDPAVLDPSGAPDIRNADAWLSDACEQLASLAHEHNDDRLMNLRATLADIGERAVILPRELAASLALTADRVMQAAQEARKQSDWLLSEARANLAESLRADGMDEINSESFRSFTTGRLQEIAQAPGALRLAREIAQQVLGERERDDSMDELDSSGRDCDRQVEQGPDFTEQARELGRQAGRNAGSWAADGNTSAEHARKVLAMIDAGDPEVLCFLPREPNLSGEFADDPTPHSIASGLLGNDQEPEDRDALADAWEEGVSETFQDACVAQLRSFLPDDDDPEPMPTHLLK